ncbi:MAG: alpha/beta hydrolase [Bacteroidia bacterium]|nr:alpha/beta hydrolase [Bacteroidia bacterium]
MDLPILPSNLRELEKFIHETELQTPHLRPDNEARILWAKGSEYQKTPYSLVFLHGFSASYKEIDPIHREFGERYGCNVYLSRLHAHGVDTPEPMLDFTPESFMDSGLFALAVGEQIGEKVILITASTGSTLGIYLAAHFPEIAALICYSPNIDLYSSITRLLAGPWGLHLARLVFRGNYRDREIEGPGRQYWIARHRIEALIALKNLIRSTMKPETFQRVKQPFFMAYYYKNRQLQDKTVSVQKMQKMYRLLGTPPELKWKKSFPQAGVHAIGSPYTSGEAEALKAETFRFAEEVLKLRKI